MFGIIYTTAAELDQIWPTLVDGNTRFHLYTLANLGKRQMTVAKPLHVKLPSNPTRQSARHKPPAAAQAMDEVSLVQLEPAGCDVPQHSARVCEHPSAH